MRLSPDDLIFWQHGFVKLNGTIVFTWALMLVMAVGAKLVTRKLSTDLNRSPWQNLLEVIVSGIAGQIKGVGLASPEMGLILQSALIIGMAMIGGMGTLGGPLVGALLLQPLSEYVREFGLQHMVIFSLLMILIIRFWRTGLYGSLKRLAERAISHGQAEAAVDG